MRSRRSALFKIMQILITIQKVVFELPEFVGEVNLVLLRVDNSLILGEELSGAFVLVSGNLFECWHIIDEFTVLENGLHEFNDFVIFRITALYIG